MLNLNVGILGHVDSGKTSLAKVLSQVASTAAFDKNPQSQTRGITLDLGFSCFCVPTPVHLKDTVSAEEIQFTLVDCPGHASLIKTIIGGAHIVDMVLLVIDINKGIQTQTAECIVIAEITCHKMIIVLNKIDLIEKNMRLKAIEKMKKKLKITLKDTHFCEAPIVGVSVKQINEAYLGIDELVKEISNYSFIPVRNVSDSLLFAIDHCFPIKGQGTVITGTVLQGTVKVNDSIDLPSINATKKVKSLQMFRKPVTSASQGDRLGICLTQFDSKLLERGIACAPGFAAYIHCAVISLNRIKYFKGRIKTKSKFHITIGYETVVATVLCFSSVQNNTNFNIATEFEFCEELPVEEEQQRKYYLLLEFEKPVLAYENCILIGSKLDMDFLGNDCRIAFWGNLLLFCRQKDYKTSFLPALKVYRIKSKTGIVERISSDDSIIVKNMFKKETNINLFVGFKIRLSTGEEGIVQSSFGKSGKVKVQIKEILVEMRDMLENKVKQSEQCCDNISNIKAVLEFKKYIFDIEKKIVQ